MSISSDDLFGNKNSEITPVSTSSLSEANGDNKNSNNNNNNNNNNSKITNKFMSQLSKTLKLKGAIPLTMMTNPTLGHKLVGYHSGKRRGHREFERIQACSGIESLKVGTGNSNFETTNQ
ncbi:hypothetical protein RFI_28931 [Reticulomyxa filosa]|uniref:Uncharacterized protein n=1 Tax=Reticulomyxa filosa TaxID=46433 RepID=X6M3F3_RETFI|nr:hypothetical protein RFI_28931 [Reticulomyxa filosa]|eukprot:ETO08454.1 hypothetical protein RFI_28931 [Reticulomyxa filosa]